MDPFHFQHLFLVMALGAFWLLLVVFVFFRGLLCFVVFGFWCFGKVLEMSHLSKSLCYFWSTFSQGPARPNPGDWRLRPATVISAA